MFRVFNVIKKILIISILFAILSFFIEPIKTVFAATYYTQTVKSGIDKFPQEYQDALNKLKELHPNWTFDAYYTGLDWDTLILNEKVCKRNRVIKSSDESWKCSCGNVASGYACASEKIISYYLDPRNFLNEVNIFQFLEISYNEKIHNVEGVKSAVKNTFLSKDITYTLNDKEYTKSYSEIILEAAKESNMSPYSIASKIIQEVGTKGSGSVSGTYSGYEGYYNFYNLGAYDTGNAIANGLMYARDKGWNNQYTAIIEGAKELAHSYTNAGQNTAYFYKWDVVGTKILKSGETQTISSSNMFWHQFMTNVQDPTSQSKSLFNTYGDNKLLDEGLNFIIPVYNNMPNSSSMPSGLTTDDGDLYYVNCTDGLAVREKPTTSSTALTRLYKNTVVVVLERECKEADGYKWDKVKLANGIEGYVASKWLTFKAASTKKDDNKNDNNLNYKIVGDNIKLVPGVNLTDIDKNAKGELKTGAKITVNGKEYTAVVMGDTNGDGEASAGDYVLIKNHIMETKILENDVQKLAADVNGDNEISPADYVLIKNYIMNGNELKLK